MMMIIIYIIIYIVIICDRVCGYLRDRICGIIAADVRVGSRLNVVRYAFPAVDGCSLCLFTAVVRVCGHMRFILIPVVLLYLFNVDNVRTAVSLTNTPDEVTAFDFIQLVEKVVCLCPAAGHEFTDVFNRKYDICPFIAVNPAVLN